MGTSHKPPTNKLTVTIQLTDQSIPRSRVLHEQLAVTQLVKEFTAFYGGEGFNTMLTRAYHYFLC